MEVTEEEITGIKKLVSDMNAVENGLVVVEGKKDAAALEKIGYKGKIVKFHSFQGMVEFTDFAAKYDNVIVLFDRDRKGRQFNRKAIKLLERRTRVDTSFKRKMQKTTKGKIMFVEQLGCYEYFLV